MRIRGNDKIADYLEQGAAILHLSPQPIPLELAAQFTERRLEIGCGKGAFLAQISTLHPDVLFVGIDKFVPIVARAAAQAAKRELINVRIYKADISSAPEFLPARYFSVIYLNFSDPWPKRRQEKHRLTHPRLLALYERLLTRGGTLEFKTDNAEFFAWSLRSLEKSGWQMLEVDENVAAEAPPGREVEGKFVQTEYETRFRGLGQAIFYIRAEPPQA